MDKEQEANSVGTMGADQPSVEIGKEIIKIPSIINLVHLRGTLTQIKEHLKNKKGKVCLVAFNNE